MDPSYNLSLIRPTQKFQKSDNFFSTPKITPVVDYQNNIHSLINHDLLNQINELQPILKGTKELQRQLNQFSGIHSSKFKSSDAVLMANLDALTNISGHLHGLLVPKTFDYNIDLDQKFEIPTVPGIVEFESLEVRNPLPKYLLLYGAPGGFVEYLEWRIPKIYGYGITDRGNDWNLSLIQRSGTLAGFERIYGDSGSGRLKDHGLDFIVTLQEKSPDGIDFIIAEGQFTGYDLYMEILISVLTVKARGNILLRLQDTWSKIIVDIIYILSLIFESIEIIKPVMSNPATSERYLWCQSRRDGIDDLTEILNLLIEGEVTGLFQELPKDFTIWLSRVNNILGRKQLDFLKNIVSAGNNETVVLEKIDLDRSLIIWGIPK